MDTLAIELESLIEKLENTSEQKRAILETIQALLNFELRLSEDIKLVERSQKYSNLQEVIDAASAEKRVKGSASRANNNDRNKYYIYRNIIWSKPKLKKLRCAVQQMRKNRPLSARLSVKLLR